KECPIEFQDSNNPRTARSSWIVFITRSTTSPPLSHHADLSAPRVSGPQRYPSIFSSTSALTTRDSRPLTLGRRAANSFFSKVGQVGAGTSGAADPIRGMMGRIGKITDGSVDFRTANFLRASRLQPSKSRFRSSPSDGSVKYCLRNHWQFLRPSW